MQNVTLPDGEEIEAAMGRLARSRVSGWRLFRGVYRPEAQLLEAFVRALYAKHGEECPLFREGGEDEVV